MYIMSFLLIQVKEIHNSDTVISLPVNGLICEKEPPKGTSYVAKD